VSYPRYDIQRTRPVFSSRQQLLEYQDALGLAARVDTALEVGRAHTHTHWAGSWTRAGCLGQGWHHTQLTLSDLILHTADSPG